MLKIRESTHLSIPYEDIQSATKNFATQIGRGGYGPVYRGQLSISGKLTVVAVKQLQTVYGQGAKQFLTEIQLLSRYKHQNLVLLVGFCKEQNEKFLVYEYAEHGSLDKYLKPVNTRCPFTWKQRVNICVDAARGLDHLHNHVAQNERVIHRDIKSANILLDHNWKAMIADLGLSKLGRANETDTFLITDPSGTRGYCDPAYIDTGILTKKSDVYSFGVVLLEVLCGRMCVINVNTKERFLVPLAQRYYEQGKLNLIVDSNLKNHMNSDSMKVFSEIAFQCLQKDREQRPSMDLVLEKLEKSSKLLENEEASELLELEEVLGLQKVVETFQMQDALELQIGESLIDYDVIEAIYSKRDTPPSYITRDKVYSLLSTGFLFDDGKVWVSINDDGKTQEMISAIKVLPLDGDGYSIRSEPESRFSKIAEVSFSSILGMQVKIKTQFLSSNVTYAVYLVCKPDFLLCEPVDLEVVDLIYTLNNTSELYVSYSHKIDDNGRWMFELFQTCNLERIADFEVTFRTKLLPVVNLERSLLIEGIQFQPIQKFVQFEDEEEIVISDLRLLSTSNIEWDKLLPNDYKRYLYYSNNEMMKTPQREVIFPSKDEAYSILSGGVLIYVNYVGKMWFWITKLDGKKCFMLPPKLNTYNGQRTRDDEWCMLPSTESRFKNIIHLLPSNTLVGLPFDVPNRLLSTDTSYGCFLVYKLPPDFVWKAIVKIKLVNRYEIYDFDGKLMHLGMPQSPVIGPDGVFRSPNPINDLKTIQLPKKRKDGWLEMDLGNMSHIRWTNMQQHELSKNIQPRDKSTWKSWFLPFMSDKESSNVVDNDTHNNFTLDHHCFSSIYMYFCPIDSFTQTPGVFVQGIEFRPI